MPKGLGGQTAQIRELTVYGNPNPLEILDYCRRTVRYLARFSGSAPFFNIVGPGRQAENPMGFVANGKGERDHPLVWNMLAGRSHLAFNKANNRQFAIRHTRVIRY